MAGYFSDKARENLFDLKIAGYLLNPLKDSYVPVDIARDYLNVTIPSIEDILGKQKIEDAIEEEKEEAFRLLARNTRVTFLGQEVLEKKLEEEGMKQLFFELEMPLVFLLYEMQMEGIQVNKEELMNRLERYLISILQNNLVSFCLKS